MAYTPPVWHTAYNFNDATEDSGQTLYGRVKYTFQPPTCTEVRFSTFNYETGLKNTLQLLKPDKFGHQLVSKAIFYF